MFCLSLWKKSTLTPLMPHFLSVWNSSRRIFAVVHHAAGLLGDVVVRAAGVVPQQQAHALAVGVGDQVVDRAVLHPVPVGVDERVLPAHLGGQIDPGLELGAVLRAVVVEEPAPGGPARLDPARVLHDRRRAHVGDERGFDDVAERIADDDDPPGRGPGQRRGGLDARRCESPSPSSGKRMV